MNDIDKYNITEVSFLGHRFKNPIIGSAGCVGYGNDFLSINPKSQYSGWVLKSITPEPLEGNLSPRVCETDHGFINSIGLQNPGVKEFKNKYHDALKHLPGVKIGSIAAFDELGYVKCLEEFNELENIDLIEMNLSCPNVVTHQIFASDAILLKTLVKKCQAIKKKPVIIKLSPNVTSIAEMVKIVEGEGGDAVTIANTFWGMKIDIQTKEPMIKNIIGGYSGPGIKPIVTALLYQARKVSTLPIIALGGVMDSEDVIEYLLAGANLVGVGTANFIDGNRSFKLEKGLKKYLQKNNETVNQIIGGIKL